MLLLLLLPELVQTGLGKIPRLVCGDGLIRIRPLHILLAHIGVFVLETLLRSMPRSSRSRHLARSGHAGLRDEIVLCRLIHLSLEARWNDQIARSLLPYGFRLLTNELRRVECSIHTSRSSQIGLHWSHCHVVVTVSGSTIGKAGVLRIHARLTSEGILVNLQCLLCLSAKMHLDEIRAILLKLHTFFRRHPHGCKSHAFHLTSLFSCRFELHHRVLDEMLVFF